MTSLQSKTSTLTVKEIAEFAFEGYTSILERYYLSDSFIPVDPTILSKWSNYTMSEIYSLGDNPDVVGYYNRAERQIVIVSGEISKHRKRWLLARGLGFLLLEEQEISSTGKLQPDYVDLCSSLSSEQDDLANKFASYLLIPDSYLKTLKNPQESFWKIVADCRVPMELVKFRMDRLEI